MFKESRLIHVTPTLSTAPRADTEESASAPNIAHAIETSRAIKDSDKRLQSLRATIEQGQTTEERMRAVETLVAQDQSQESVLLANQMIDAEIARTSTEKNQLEMRVQQTSQQQLTELQARIERASQARHAVLQAENIRLQSQETFTGGLRTSLVSAKNAITEKTDIALPELKNSLTEKQKWMIGLGATAGLIGVFYLGKQYLKNGPHTWPGKIWRKLTGKNEAEKGEDANKEVAPKRGFFGKLIRYGVIAGLGITAFVGIKKGHELYKKIQSGTAALEAAKQTAAESFAQAKQLAEDTKRVSTQILDGAKTTADTVMDRGQTTADANANDDATSTIDAISGSAVTVPNAAVDAAPEVLEDVTNTSETKAFAFEHFKEFGALEENELVALNEIIHSQAIQDLPVAEFNKAAEDNTIEQLLTMYKLPSQFHEHQEMLAVVVEIIQNIDPAKYETMADVFSDSTIGGITARIRELTKDKSILELKPEEITKAALDTSNEGMTALIKKPKVKQAFTEVGITEKMLPAFIAYLVPKTNIRSDNNEIINHPKFGPALQKMNDFIQTPSNVALIEQFAHNKSDATQALTEQILHKNNTRLTPVDTVELFTYLQLLRSNTGAMPTAINEGSPVGAYLLQMKALDLLSKSQNGKDAAHELRGYLYTKTLSVDLDLNLPPEVIEQLSSIAESIFEEIFSHLQEKANFVWNESAATIKEYAKQNPKLATLIGILGLAEAKNMFDGAIVRKFSRMNPANAHEFGFYGDKFIATAVDNSKEYKRIQFLLNPLTYGKRIPGLSQLITKRFIIKQRFLSIQSLGAADEFEVASRLKALGKTHVTENVVEQLKRISKLVNINGAGTIGDSSFFERIKILIQNQDVTNPGKLRNSILNLDQFSWKKVNAVHDLIEDVKANRKINPNKLLAAGLDATVVNEAIQVFEANNIGKPTANATADTARATQRTIDALDPADEFYDILRHSSDPNLLRTKLNSEMFEALAKMPEDELAKVVPYLTDTVRTTDVTIGSIDELHDVMTIASHTDDAAKGAKVFGKMRWLRKVGKVGGGALEVTGMAFAIYDAIETRDKIANATEKGVRDQILQKYEQEHYYQAAEFTTSAIGFGALFVGGSVGTPVAIAALPVTAAIMAGKEWHEWETAKMRSVNDWKSEFNNQELLSDAKNLGYGEMVALGMDAEYGNRSWTDLYLKMNPLTAPIHKAYELASGRTMDEAKRVMNELEEKNRKQVLAAMSLIHIHAPVTFAEKQPDGSIKEVAATPEQKQQIEFETNLVTMAMTDYIMNETSKNGEIFANTNKLSTVLTKAFHYAKLQQARYLATQGKGPMPEVPTTGTIKEQAEQFQANSERTQATALVQLNELPPARDKICAEVINQELQFIQQEVLLTFEEANFYTGWSGLGLDGNAKEIVQTAWEHAANRVTRTELERLINSITAIRSNEESDEAIQITITQAEEQIALTKRNLHSELASFNPEAMYTKLMGSKYEQNINRKNELLAELASEGKDESYWPGMQAKVLSAQRKTEIKEQIQSINSYLASTPISFTD